MREEEEGEGRRPIFTRRSCGSLDRGVSIKDVGGAIADEDDEEEEEENEYDENSELEEDGRKKKVSRTDALLTVS